MSKDKKKTIYDVTDIDDERKKSREHRQKRKERNEKDRGDREDEKTKKDKKELIEQKESIERKEHKEQKEHKEHKEHKDEDNIDYNEVYEIPKDDHEKIHDVCDVREPSKTNAYAYKRHIHDSVNVLDSTPTSDVEDIEDKSTESESDYDNDRKRKNRNKKKSIEILSNTSSNDYDDSSKFEDYQSSEHSSEGTLNGEMLEVLKQTLGSMFITSTPHRPCYRDKKGRKLEPVHKNVADILQELVYVLSSKD
jgi:hypothetical protein